MKHKLILVAAIIAVIALAFLIMQPNINPSAKVIADNNVKEFTLDAVRFSYSPDTITVNKGDRVKITINNIDTLHGIRIPDFNARDENAVEFVADKSGEFDFYCTVFCGDGHREMKGKLIVK